MAIGEVSDSDFETKVIKSKKPVLVDFWAPWCGPCKMAEPVLEDLSKEYQEKLIFVKINVDQNKITATKYQIMSIPTTIIFKSGKEVNHQVGFSGKEAYLNLIKQGLQGGD